MPRIAPGGRRLATHVTHAERGSTAQHSVTNHSAAQRGTHLGAGGDHTVRLALNKGDLLVGLQRAAEGAAVENRRRQDRDAPPEQRASLQARRDERPLSERRCSGCRAGVSTLAGAAQTSSRTSERHTPEGWCGNDRSTPQGTLHCSEAKQSMHTAAPQPAQRSRITACSTHLDDDVAGLAGGLGAGDGLNRHDLACRGRQRQQQQQQRGLNSGTGAESSSSVGSAAAAVWTAAAAWTPAADAGRARRNVHAALARVLLERTRPQRRPRRPDVIHPFALPHASAAPAP